MGDLNRGKVISGIHKANIKAAALTRKKPVYSKESLANMAKYSKPIILYNLDRTVYGEYPSITAGAESLRCSVKTRLIALNTPKKKYLKNVELLNFVLACEAEQSSKTK